MLKTNPGVLQVCSYSPWPHVPDLGSWKDSLQSEQVREQILCPDSTQIFPSHSEDAEMRMDLSLPIYIQAASFPSRKHKSCLVQSMWFDNMGLGSSTSTRSSSHPYQCCFILSSHWQYLLDCAINWRRGQGFHGDPDGQTNTFGRWIRINMWLSLY